MRNLSSPLCRAEVVAAMDAHAAGFAGEAAGFIPGLILFKEGGVGVIEIFQFHAFDLLADEAFNGINVAGVLGGHDGKGVAAGLGAAGAPDAVDVILRMLRHVVIDDMAHVSDIQAARGDVRGDQHFKAAFTEPLQSLFALALGAVGMQDGHGVVRAFQGMRHAVGAVFGAAEDDHRIVMHRVEELEEQVGFLHIGHGIDDVLDGLGRRTARADLDGFGVVHRPFDERLDLRRDGGGKKGGVALARTTFNDLADVGQKAHVQHPVGLVQDEKLHLVQAQGALLEMVQQAAGGGDDDIGAGAQFIRLPAITDSAKNDGDVEIGEARVGAEGGFHLGGQFTGRFQDERAGASARQMFVEFGKDRQGEGRGLAGAGLGAADDVAPRQHERDGAKLDGRRIGVTLGFDPFHHCRSEA